MSRAKQKKSDFYSFYANPGSGAESSHSFKRRKRSAAPFIFFFMLLLACAAASWYGYLFFSSKLDGGHDPITLTVTAPSTSQEQSPITYTVRYKNSGSLTFEDADIVLEYPSQFVVTETSPVASNAMKNFWNIGTLEPGTESTITIQGVLNGSESEEKELSVVFHYRHPVYRSSFTIRKSAVTTITKQGEGALRIVGPASLHAGDSFEYTVHTTNLADFGGTKPLFLIVEYPPGFHIVEEKPAPQDAQKHEWTRDALGSGEIVLKGTLDQHPQSSEILKARFELQQEDGSRIVIGERSHETAILFGDVSLSLKVNGFDKPSSVQIGSTVHVTLSYENRGTLSYEDVTITFSPESSLINIDAITAEGSEKKDGTIVWSPRTVPALKKIDPTQKGEFSLQMPLADYAAFQDHFFQAGYDQSKFQAILLKTAGTIGGEQSFSGSEMLIPVLSDARLTAFTKEIINEGGKAGVHSVRVYWSIENTFHDLTDIRVSGVLPSGVTWAGMNNRTAGDILYDEKTRTVSWTLNRLPLSVKRIDGSFDVSAGNTAFDSKTGIVQKITMVAQDSTAGGTLSQTIPVLTMTPSAQ